MTFKKTGKLIVASLLIVGLLFVATSAYAEIIVPETNDDALWIEDLSNISGLPQSTIGLLNDALGDKEYIQENIFLITRIIAISEEYGIVDLEVLQQLREVNVSDLLASYELAKEKDLKASALRKIIERLINGEKTEKALADTFIEETHKVYLPAAKDQIRQWLNSGFIVEDILRADTISMSLDLEINTILQEKTDNVSWEEIEILLGYTEEFKEKKPVSVLVESVDGMETLSADDYTTLVDESKIKAQQIEDKKIKELKDKEILSEDQFNAYLNEGFNTYEIENAIKLSKGDLENIDEILMKKQGGESWEEIIFTYTDNKEAENE